jgi:chromosomal replication initiator protein
MDSTLGTARNLDLEGAMGNVADVAAAADHGDAAVADRILRQLRTRIGDDRFAVWFGDGVRLTTAADAHGRRVSVIVGSGFSHEWLRRTFREELESAVQAVCGPDVRVTWEPAGEGPEDAAVAPPPSRRRGAPRRSKASAAPEGRLVPAARRAGELVVVPGRPAAPAAVRRTIPRLADFVVGPSNRMAFAAAEMAIQRPGEMSPLVIHGPSGVGKTHLLEGLCERVRELHPGVNAVCLSAEQFTTAFLQSLHASGLPGFRRTCRGADLLVIDDLQFFVGKKATLLELQHTIDAMHRQGRQVVLGCDREIDALSDLGADLLTRLRGGMIVRLPPPDYEVRRGIVRAICEKRGLTVPDDVVHYVATTMTRHARELFGACNRLEATSQMLGIPVTLDMAEEALADLVRSSGRSVRLADIERAVCRAFGIDGGSLQSSRRARTTSHPRMLAMFLARKHTSAALTEIGAYFGRRSHSTVIAAQKAVGEWAAKREPIVLADATWDVEEAIRRVEDVLRAG